MPDMSQGTRDIEARIEQAYPALRGLAPSIAGALTDGNCALLELPAHARVFEQQAPCQGFPLVLDGEIRVFRASPTGRSLDLYRVVPGEICLVSSACLFQAHPLSACGETALPTRLLAAAPPLFARWMEGEAFRNWVLGLYAQRMAELTELVDALAFQRLDARLAAAVLGHGPVVATTHQALADELGTVREIVSRLLRRFERSGWVRLAREQIEVVDAPALRECAQGALGDRPNGT